MDGTPPDPALMRTDSHLTNNQIPCPFLPDTEMCLLPSRRTPSPDANACETLIHLARSIRARPVYKIERIGGADHYPIFCASLLLIPQKYSTQGVGRRKMTARRDAAANMIKLINKQLSDANPPAQPQLRPVQVRNPSSSDGKGETIAPIESNTPAVPHAENEDREIEEGEVESDNADEADKTAPFFVDREPDPELEKEAEDQRLLEKGLREVATQEGAEGQRISEGQQVGTGRQSDAEQERQTSEGQQSGYAEREAASINPKSQPNEIRTPKIEDKMEDVLRPTTKDPHQSAKRIRASTESTATSTEAETPENKLSYTIPPRKRARSVPRDFSVRLRVWVFCTYTETIMKTLKALADANLFVDLSITMYSTVEMGKYVLLGKSVAAEVTVLPEEHQKNPATLVGMLAFAVGVKSEQLWIERAKHLANGSPLGLSPRILVLHDDPSLDIIKSNGVVDVMRPSDDLVQHFGAVIDRAKESPSPS